MHNGIKKFQIKSKIADDSYFVRQRDEQERMLIQQMQDTGYIPIVALGPFWSTKYDENERYDAVLTMYGLFVGKRKSCMYMGVDGDGTLYPSPLTQKSK